MLLRRDTVGFTFQSFGLIPFLSAAENVGVPLRISGTDPREREERGLVQRPRLLIADVPTGHLDAETAPVVMRRLRDIVDREQLTALVATHDPQLVTLADTVLDLRDGALRPASGPAS